MCENPSWVVYAIDIVLFIASLLAIYLMQKAEHDQQIRRIDPRWIRNARRLSFIAIAMLAFLTILTDVSLLAILFLFSASVVLLIVDILALQQRPPQSGRHAATVVARQHGMGMTPLRSLMAMFRQGHDHID